MTEKAYKNFVGIDIGKFELVAAVHGKKQTETFENNEKGWGLFHKEWKLELKEALVVIETTGGHELGLILFLRKLKISVHRANTRQVKNFIRSLGQMAKTDALDAQGLARYGAERQESLKLFVAAKDSLKLYQLAQRRRDLKKILVQEKNRVQGGQRL